MDKLYFSKMVVRSLPSHMVFYNVTMPYPSLEVGLFSPLKSEWGVTASTNRMQWNAFAWLLRLGQKRSGNFYLLLLHTRSGGSQLPYKKPKCRCSVWPPQVTSGSSQHQLPPPGWHPAQLNLQMTAAWPTSDLSCMRDLEWELPDRLLLN